MTFPVKDVVYNDVLCGMTLFLFLFFALIAFLDDVVWGDVVCE